MVTIGLAPREVGQALASPIHTPFTSCSSPLVSATTTLTESTETLVQAIDKSGLSAGYTSGVTDFDTYVAGSPTHMNTGGPGMTDFIGTAADPALESIRGYVEDSGEGRWTVQEAIDLNVPAPVITLSLLDRFRSRQEESFSAKVIAALRHEFGGHAVKST